MQLVLTPILRAVIRKNSTCVFGKFYNMLICVLEVHCVTIWHIQKLYTDDGVIFEASPYDLFSTVKSTLKIKPFPYENYKGKSSECL